MSGRRCQLTTWILLLLPCACGGEKPPPPDGYFVWEGMTAASGGEAIFLRGINVREDAKYHPQHLLPLSEAQLDELRRSGFSTVSRPTALSVQVDPPALDAEFACSGGRRVEILLPGWGSWKVDYSPPGSLTTPQVDGQLLRARCAGSQHIELRLEKNP